MTAVVRCCFSNINNNIKESEYQNVEKQKIK